MLDWLFGSKPIHTCEYRKRTEITSISEESLREFYDNLSWDKKYEMTTLAYGHRCEYAECCDHFDLVELSMCSDIKLSEFLIKHGFATSRSKRVSFKFSDDWSINRYIHKSMEIDFRPISNDTHSACEVNLASKISQVTDYDENMKKFEQSVRALKDYKTIQRTIND